MLCCLESCSDLLGSIYRLPESLAKGLHAPLHLYRWPLPTPDVCALRAAPQTLRRSFDGAGLLRREMVKESGSLLRQVAQTIAGNAEIRCVKLDAKPAAIKHLCCGERGARASKRINDKSSCWTESPYQGLQYLYRLLSRMQDIAGIRPFNNIADGLCHAPGRSLHQKVSAFMLVLHIAGR